MDDTKRVVILGKTGAGKSSLGNTIFGKKVFKVDHSLNSQTRKCQAETKSVHGRRINLIDTPDFFDTQRSEEDLKLEVLRCMTECASGPHAFLIVLKVEKFTVQEQAVIKIMHMYLSDEALKYAAVVFTHGDQLPEGWKIEEFVSQNQLLSDLVKKCGGRCHTIDNKYWNKTPKNVYRSNRFQVEQLLKTIDEITEVNHRSYYTNDMLQVVEKVIQHEVQCIRQSSGEMSEEEIRKQAKVSTSEVLLTKLTDTAAGALLAALCGVGATAGSESVPLGQAITKTAKSVGPGAFGVIGRTAAGVTAGASEISDAVGVAKRCLTGNDSSEEAAESKPKMGRFS